MDTSFQSLSEVLWRERELLEGLQYALEVEQLVLASGRSRWLMRAAKDVEAVLDDLRQTEVLRAVASDAAASTCALPAGASLQELAEGAPDPWGEMLREHRDAFVAMTREITALADTNRELITHGYRSARETLLAMGEENDGYSADGSAVVAAAAAGGRPHRIVDRSF